MFKHISHKHIVTEGMYVLTYLYILRYTIAQTV